MEKLTDAILLAAVTIVTVLLVGLLIALPLMWGWNEAVSPIFDLPRISFWQALGLYVVFSALFKSHLRCRREGIN